MRENADAVSSGLAVEEAVALEIDAVDVLLRAKSRQVPRHFISLTHVQAFDIPIHKPIDCWNKEGENKHRGR